MDQTPNLELPFIMAAQAQKHITHNEALRILDALVQLSVIDRNLAAPPGSPADGDRYIVAAGPTGAWAGHTDEIAAWQDGAWAFFAPEAGWIAWVGDEAKLFAWDGSAWVPVGEDSLNPTPLVGVNATADATNRLAVSSPATLLNHEGAGHQLKISKNAVSDTASVLLQTNFSGRAEVGTCGDDDFHIKVSADGATWREALVIDKDTAELIATASSASAVPLSLMAAASQTAALLCLAGSTGPLSERPASNSLNAVNWRQVVNQNPYASGGVGNEAYANEVMAIGWNQQGTIGVRDVAGYPAFDDRWEFKYHVGSSGKYWTERHVAVQVDTSGVEHRPFSFAQAHDGSEATGEANIDQWVWSSYNPQTVKIQWQPKNNVAYFGSTSTGFGLNFNKNDSAVVSQMNAAGNQFLKHPWIDGLDRLRLEQRISHSAPAPSGSVTVGLDFNFSGAPGNGTALLGVTAGTAATNANITAFGVGANTNWNVIADVTNWNTNNLAAAVQQIAIGGAGGWAFTRWMRQNTSDPWSAGKDGSGNFFIAQWDPSNGRCLTIDKTNLNMSFAAPPKLPSYTVAGVPSASTYGAGSLIYVSNESGGAVPAYSDGTNWRRVTDGAVVS